METIDLVNNNLINNKITSNDVEKKSDLENSNLNGNLVEIDTPDIVSDTEPESGDGQLKKQSQIPLDVEDINEIQSLTKEELIESVVEIRNEYYHQRYKYKKCKDKLEDREKQLKFQRELLSEREDLLLQLQWEPSQDDQYLNIDTENIVDRKRMRALLDQMRLMEKGIFERDARVKELEKLVEQLTLAQIGRPNEAGATGYPDEASSTFQHHQTPPHHSHSRPSTPRRAIPKFIKRLSEYSLSFKSNRNLLADDEDSGSDININHHHQHQNTPRSRPSTPTRASPSFWSRSTSMLSLLKWSSDDASSIVTTANEPTTASTIKNL